MIFFSLSCCRILLKCSNLHSDGAARQRRFSAQRAAGEQNHGDSDRRSGPVLDLPDSDGGDFDLLFADGRPWAQLEQGPRDARPRQHFQPAGGGERRVQLPVVLRAERQIPAHFRDDVSAAAVLGATRPDALQHHDGRHQLRRVAAPHVAQPQHLARARRHHHRVLAGADERQGRRLAPPPVRLHDQGPPGLSEQVVLISVHCPLILVLVHFAFLSNPHANDCACNTLFSNQDQIYYIFSSLNHIYWEGNDMIFTFSYSSVVFIIFRKYFDELNHISTLYSS